MEIEMNREAPQILVSPEWSTPYALLGQYPVRALSGPQGCLHNPNHNCN